MGKYIFLNVIIILFKFIVNGSYYMCFFFENFNVISCFKILD